MIAVDASALVAIALGEPDANHFADRLRGASARFIAPVNYVETGLVLRRQGLIASRSHLDEWFSAYEIVVDDKSALAQTALTAYLRFGKGIHPARLNLADCFAYALAKELDAPLLYKGDDFAMTDIRSALQPT